MATATGSMGRKGWQILRSWAPDGAICLGDAASTAGTHGQTLWQCKAETSGSLTDFDDKKTKSRSEPCNQASPAVDHS